MNKSNTEKVEWNTFDWTKVQSKVFKLQKRIYQASLNGNVQKVRKLQKTLMRSWSNKLLATRKVTQDNRGKRTAGVDGVKLVKPEQRLELANSLKLSDKSRATRRVWIPKPGKTEKRPLGIPTMLERAKQALVKAALEPEWEAIFEPSSYGFRPGRSCQDAIRHINDSIQHSSKYVLDADIAQCFDSINHSTLLLKLKQKGTVRRQVKAWLKAGVLDQGVFSETTKGTPQGGVISPLLANIALHGLEEHLMQFARNSKGWTYKSGRPIVRIDREQSLTFIRYADDFVVLHNSKSVILECKKIISEWLKDIGLELKPEKTRLTHTLLNEESEDGKSGFDFLGFHIQQYEAGIHQDCLWGNQYIQRHLGFKTLITPSIKAVEKHHKSIKAVLKEHSHKAQAALITKLNPIIKGWSNYYRYSDIKTAGISNKEDYVLFGQLMKWGIKRCKGNVNRAKKNYWHHIESRKYVFATRTGKTALKLILHSDTECSSNSYVKVKGNRSPFDGDWKYWSIRMGDYPEVSRTIAGLLKKQKGRCTYCGQYFQDTDLMEIDHIKPKCLDGSNQWDNLQLMHAHCHDSKTANDLIALKDSKLKAKTLRDSIELRWLDGDTDFTSEEEKILDEILLDRCIDNEATKAKFVNHSEKRKRNKTPKARKSVQYKKGKRIKTQEATKIARTS